MDYPKPVRPAKLLPEQIEQLRKDVLQSLAELGLRPIRHQNADRTGTRLFTGVMVFHIPDSTENSLKAYGDTREWNTIKKILSTHERSTVILRGTDKKVYHLRISGNPETCHKEIYGTLNVKDTLRSRKRCEISRFW